MGVALDTNPESFWASSTTGGFVIHPPAIHRNMDSQELEELQSLFYKGSGGSASSLMVVSPSGTQTQVILPQNALAAAIDQICGSFHFTKEELTKTLGLQSRKSIYNWINGTVTPRKQALDKIYSLLFIARSWEKSGLVFSRAQLQQPLIDGQGILDLLAEPTTNKELILFAGSRIDSMSYKATSLPDPFA